MKDVKAVADIGKFGGVMRYQFAMNLLLPVAQLYGHVRMDWNQSFVIDCSLSHPAGNKPFTCSHSVLRKT